MRKPWTPFWRLLPYEVMGRLWMWHSRRRLRRDGIVPLSEEQVGNALDHAYESVGGGPWRKVR